jgi:myo-inositol-1(or 4)-monophosphatase
MLEAALEATLLSAKVLSERFQTTVAIETKGLANFVTQADLDSERVIVETIRERFQDHSFIGEESHSDRADAKDLWIIDPLDGTSNFMHGIPHFAISISYYRDGQPELGIVCNPIRKDWYVAVRGQGSWHNGVRMQVDTADRIDAAMITCGFYYDRDRMMQATLDTIGDFFRNNIHGMRRFGAAALDLCNVACGQYGLFFEFKLHPWDYGAGQLILTEAGGLVTDCNGLELPLHQASSICATNALIHSQALEIIAPHWNRLNALVFEP